MKSRSRKSKSKKPRVRKSAPINFKPIAALSVIALLMIGFIYWSEHSTVPAKRAPEPVKQAAAPAKKLPAPEKREAVPVKKAPPVKQKAAAPTRIAKIRQSASSIFVKPAVPDKVVVRPPVIERIEKKRVVPIPPVMTVRKRPKVAIVIDDFGYNMNNVEAFFDIGMPITMAVLPQQRYSHRIAERARSRGYEVILHLPLESWRPEAKEETDTIRSGMSESEIIAMLKKEIADVPGLSGVNNHQGSKATEDKQVMTDVMEYLKKKGLYFCDSFTTAKSVCPEVASEVGIKFARRNKFIDNDNNAAAIERQLAELKTMAFARGKAIAIGHDRKTTVAVLAKVMPEMAKEGIEFVYLSEMVK